MALSDLLAMFGGGYEGLLGNAGFYAQIILLMALVVLSGGVYYWLMNEYKHRVILIKHNRRIKIDRMRKWFDKRTKQNKRQLLFARKEVLPESEDETPYVYGRGEAYILYETAKGNYVPLRQYQRMIGDQPADVLETIDADVDLWMAWKHQQDQEDYGNIGFWQKYGTFVASSMVVALILITMWFGYEFAEGTINRIANLADEAYDQGPVLAELRKISESINKLDAQDISSYGQEESVEETEPPPPPPNLDT